MPRLWRLRCVLFIWIVGLVSACGWGGAEPTSLVVFAASSLTDAFRALGEAFAAANPDAAIVFNFASSSQLAAGLVEGATADVFAAANPAQMQAVVAGGRIDPAGVIAFAVNSLALVVPADDPAALTGLADLARPGVTLVLAAPGVPARDYADAILAGLPPATREGILANVVSEEANVRQVLAKVALGEADAGIVYATDVTPEMANQVRRLPLPEATGQRPSYPIAPLRDAPRADLAARFVAFVLSGEGQAILAAHGFAPPPEAGP